MDRLKQKALTIYAFVVFLFFALFVAIPLVTFYRIVWPHDEARKLQFHRFLCHFFHWCAHHIPSAGIVVDNPGNENFEKPSILICNHQSHLDLVCTLMLSPRIVAMTNHWVWNFPLYAPVIHYLEYYPAAEGVVGYEEQLAKLLKRGYSLLVFPEGTRSASCRILRFHRGAFYLAEQLHADIVPIYLHDAGRVLPKDDFCLHPGTIRVEIGQRVRYGDQQMGSTSHDQMHAWHKLYKSKIDGTI